MKIKSTTLNIAASMLLLFAGVTVFNGCKNPIEGFVLTIKADYTTAPNTFRILDAKTNAPALMPNYTIIKITGKDAGLVYEPSGSKTIKIVDGAIQLAFRKGVNPTKTNPMVFNIVVEVDGFLPLIYPVEICSPNPITQNISVVNTASLPSGSSLVKNNVPTDNSGKVTNAITIANTPIIGKTETSKVTIPAGTQLLDASGAPVTGTVEASVIHFTGNSIASLNSFPGGLFTNKVQAANGTSLPAGSFAPVSWIVMDMSVGSKAVKSFSQPINAVLELSPTTINPVTHSIYKAGDLITIWSKSGGKEFWVKENTGTVTKNAISNKLEITMSMNHLSVWAAANFNESCEQDVKITVTNSDNTVTHANIALAKSVDNVNFVEIGVLTVELVPGTNVVNLKDYFTTFSFSANDIFKATISFDGAAPVIIGPTAFCGASLPATLPTTNKTTIDYKLSIKCNQNFILLPDNYTVYYIKEADYQNTIIPTPTDHKVNPYDLNSTGQSYYKAVRSKTVTGNANYGMISLLKSSLQTATEYRCIIYYQNQRYDKLFTAPAASVLEAGQTQDLEVVIANCPL